MTTDVVVGRIGKAHGLRGEVSVEPRTDEPDRRFAPGAVLTGTRPNGTEPRELTVRSVRSHADRLLVLFEEIADRNAAEAARNLVLSVTVDPAERPDDPEEFYDHQLVGLAAYTTEGDQVGTVVEVIHAGGQDLLAIRTGAGADGEVEPEALVPFVRALVPVVDLEAGRVEIADRPGLLRPVLEEPDELDRPGDRR